MPVDAETAVNNLMQAEPTIIAVVVLKGINPHENYETGFVSTLPGKNAVYGGTERKEDGQ